MKYAPSEYYGPETAINNGQFLPGAAFSDILETTGSEQAALMDCIAEEPQGDERVSSLFTQPGQDFIGRHVIDPNGQTADEINKYLVYGEPARQLYFAAEAADIAVEYINYAAVSHVEPVVRPVILAETAESTQTQPEAVTELPKHHGKHRKPREAWVLPLPRRLVHALGRTADIS